jgi:hypothetical protein
MCYECATELGGVFPEDHVCTVTRGECPYCKTQDVVLIPWIDFNWPEDKASDKVAKGNRD